MINPTLEINLTEEIIKELKNERAKFFLMRQLHPKEKEVFDLIPDWVRHKKIPLVSVMRVVNVFSKNQKIKGYFTNEVKAFGYLIFEDNQSYSIIQAEVYELLKDFPQMKAIFKNKGVL